MFEIISTQKVINIGIKGVSSSQVLLIKCTGSTDHQHLYKSRSLVSLLVCSIQVCVKTIPRRKDISNDHRKAIVDAHQSGILTFNS